MNKQQNLVLQSINVNIIDTNSGIFVGDNLQCYWNSSIKTTTGFTINGQQNFAQGNITSIVKKDY